MNSIKGNPIIEEILSYFHTLNTVNIEIHKSYDACPRLQFSYHACYHFNHEEHVRELLSRMLITIYSLKCDEIRISYNNYFSSNSINIPHYEQNCEQHRNQLLHTLQNMRRITIVYNRGLSTALVKIIFDKLSYNTLSQTNSLLYDLTKLPTE